MRRLLVALTLGGLLSTLLSAYGPPEAPSVAPAPEVATRTAAPLAAHQEDGGTVIRIMPGAFDPLDELAPVPDQIPLVDPSSLAPGAPNYWFVQAAGGDIAGGHAAIEAEGGSIEAAVPETTWIVRATPTQIEAIRAHDTIRAAVLYQPGWKVPVGLGEYDGLLAVGGSQTYQVFVFDSEPDPAAVARQVGTIGGVEILADAGRILDIRATAAEIPAVAAVTGVEWIEIRAQAVALNAQARWVNDTAVRDVYSATAPGRLTGAGQAAGVADTGVNYINDKNGHAHISFRDCDESSSTVAQAVGCKEADYTQVNPGTGTSNLLETQDNATGHRKMAAYFDLGTTGPNPSDDSAHGSHVSGSVTGDHGAYGTWDGEDGMAPAARLVHQNIGSPSGGLATPSDAYQLWRQAYRPRDPASVEESYTPADYADYVADEDARTHNNSYGLIAPNVSLGSAEAADEFVWEHEDMVIVSSAGNGGPGPYTMGAPSIGKNVVSSGASANGRQPMVSLDSMAVFSSHGPTPDGRYGVDLATPGQIVQSVKGGTADEFHYLQGTSMSGPVLTGLATLVREYFYEGYGPAPDPADGASASGFGSGARNAATRRHNPSAALVRATLANGAERMRGWYTGDDGSQRSLDGQYPSAGQGFGLVNLDRSLYFDDVEGRSTAANWYHDVWRADADAFGVGSGETRTYDLDVAAGEPLEVTLAFTDAPSAPVEGTVARVNNVDLTVRSPSGTAYVGNNFNTRLDTSADEYFTLGGPNYDSDNPVEKVRIPEPEAGTWTVEVRGTEILRGPQGFALAARGLTDAPDGTATFEPGAPLQTDTDGAPTVSDIDVTSVSGDLARVTWRTSEPTTGAVATTVGGAEVTYPDVYNLGNGSDGREPGYFGVEEGPVETSDAYGNKPVVGTRHEVLVTGLSPGQTYDLTITATDLADNGGQGAATLTTTDAIYGAEPFDTAQLVESGTDPVAAFDPVTGIGDGAFGLGTQLYAGQSSGTGLLGAFMFRLPESVDPSRIHGAAVELTSAHDITNHYKDDVLTYVDLLPEEMESDWQGQNYTTVHEAPKVARAYPETGERRGAQHTYPFNFTCTDLDALRQTLSTVQDGERRAAFRFDALSDQATSLFSTEFGFNRRSQGADLRPRLVLFTDDGAGGVTDPTPCDPDAPAPEISQIRVQPGLTEGSATVSWQTDVPSDSTVLFREKGADQPFTQVSSRSLTDTHAVTVLGLDPDVDYEFGVRSVACNGEATTDDNAGAGYDFFRPPPPVFDTVPWFFHGNPTDQAEKDAQFGGPISATFSQDPPDGTPGSQTTTALANESFVENPLAAYWTGPYAGELNGPITFEWYWGGTVPRTAQVSVTVFADVTRDEDGFADPAVQPDKIVAQGTMPVEVTTGPVPTVKSVGQIDVIDEDPDDDVIQATVDSELVIQVAGDAITTDNELSVHYDSDQVPSAFLVPVEPQPAPTEVLPQAGPEPPPSAASSIDLSAVALRDEPTDADLAAGTSRCAVPGPTDGGSPSGSPSDPESPSGGSQDDPSGTGSESQRGVSRLFGADRWATAIDISRDRFADGAAGVVVLARGDDGANDDGYADALAGTPLAIEFGAPLLITPPSGLLPEVEAEIRRVLGSSGRVVLLGGTVALHEDVERRIQEIGYPTSRLAGADRIGTALEIADAIDRSPGAILLTRGWEFPDALASGPAAAQVGGVILLNGDDSRHPAVDAYLDDHPGVSVNAIGGHMARLFPEANPVWGTDRFGTAVEVAEGFFDGPTVAGLARSDTFPDSLSGGAHVGLAGGPMLLTPPPHREPPGHLHPATEEYVCDRHTRLEGGYVYGGILAVSDGAHDAFADRIRGIGC